METVATVALWTIWIQLAGDGFSAPVGQRFHVPTCPAMIAVWSFTAQYTWNTWIIVIMIQYHLVSKPPNETRTIQLGIFP